jgi:hypothetical protein
MQRPYASPDPRSITASVGFAFEPGLGRSPLAERRGALAADDRGRLVHEIVVFEGLDDEQGEVDPARDVVRGIVAG